MTISALSTNQKKHTQFRDEPRYILDLKEVHAEDFPGETFRVLKEEKIRLYGEYRTLRLVLESWDKLER